MAHVELHQERTGVRDRRTARRVAYNLLVKQHGRLLRTLTTLDVSRRGLLVVTTDPAPLNHAIRLTIELPSGALPAMASVVRHVKSPDGQIVAMGLRLFGLTGELRSRWDQFVMNAAQHALTLDAGARVARRFEARRAGVLLTELEFDIDVVIND